MTEHLIEGLTLLGLGMGFVLCFLCILIAAMHVMSAIVRYLNKIFPEAVEVVEKKASSLADEGAVIAAAIAAVFAKR